MLASRMPSIPPPLEAREERFNRSARGGANSADLARVEKVARPLVAEALSHRVNLAAG